MSTSFATLQDIKEIKKRLDKMEKEIATVKKATEIHISASKMMVHNLEQVDSNVRQLANSFRV